MSDQTGNVRLQRARLSVLVFGAYLVALGSTLLLAPNLLLRIFGIPDTDEVWVRILGAVLIVLGFYQIEAARENSEWFMRASVLARAGVALALFGLVVAGAALPVIALFGAVDLAGAAWTAYALRWPRIDQRPVRA